MLNVFRSWWQRASASQQQVKVEALQHHFPGAWSPRSEIHRNSSSNQCAIVPLQQKHPGNTQGTQQALRVASSVAVLPSVTQLQLIDDLSIETFATLGVGVHPQRMESNGSYGAMATPTGECSGGSDQSGSRSDWFVISELCWSELSCILSRLAWLAKYSILIISSISIIYLRTYILSLSLSLCLQATLVYFESVWSVRAKMYGLDVGPGTCRILHARNGILGAGLKLLDALWKGAMLRRSCRSIAILLKEFNHHCHSFVVQ